MNTRPKYCAETGDLIPESAKFCPGCGNCLKPFQPSQAQPSAPEKEPTPNPPAKDSDMYPPRNPSPVPPAAPFGAKPLSAEAQAEIGRMRALTPMQALHRMQELMQSNPALIQEMAPTAQQLLAEMQRANPAAVQHVSSLFGLF